MARRVFMFRAGKWDTGLLNAQVSNSMNLCKKRIFIYSLNPKY